MSTSGSKVAVNCQCLHSEFNNSTLWLKWRHKLTKSINLKKESINPILNWKKANQNKSIRKSQTK